jgi:photosystem II stability/assembly factor-like uncharacterized protein
VGSPSGWTNFTAARLGLNDASYATTSNVAASPAVGELRNFGFTLPSNATVVGIQVGADMSANNASATAYIMFQVSKDAGSNYSNALSYLSKTGTADAYQTQGGESSLWGISWTYTNINDNTNFYIKVNGYSSASNRSCRLDLVDVTVFYTVPTTHEIEVAFSGAGSLTTTLTVVNPHLIEVAFTGSGSMACELAFVDPITWTERRPIDEDRTREWGNFCMSKNGQVVLVSVYDYTPDGATKAGATFVSTDGGSTFTLRKVWDDWWYWYPSAMNDDGSVIYVCAEGQVLRSINYGESWTNVVPTGKSSAQPNYVSCDETGDVVIYSFRDYNVASPYPMVTYISINGGTSWTELLIDSSSFNHYSSRIVDGYIYLIDLTNSPSGRIYYSDDYGDTWNEIEVIDGSAYDYRDLVVSSDRSKIYTVIRSDGVYYSDDYGATFTKIKSLLGTSYYLTISDNGNTVCLHDYSGRIWVSFNNGSVWYETRPAGDVDQYWGDHTLICSADGKLVWDAGYSTRLWSGVVISTGRQPHQVYYYDQTAEAWIECLAYTYNQITQEWEQIEFNI